MDKKIIAIIAITGAPIALLIGGLMYGSKDGSGEVTWKSIDTEYSRKEAINNGK